jgi:hypothetical protein
MTIAVSKTQLLPKKKSGRGQVVENVFLFSPPHYQGLYKPVHRTTNPADGSVETSRWGWGPAKRWANRTTSDTEKGEGSGETEKAKGSGETEKAKGTTR